MILLDTNVVIAFFYGNKAVLKRIQAEIDKIALSTFCRSIPWYPNKTFRESSACLTGELSAIISFLLDPFVYR